MRIARFVWSILLLSSPLAADTPDDDGTSIAVSGSLFSANPPFHPTALLEYFINPEESIGLLHAQGNGIEYIHMKNTFVQTRQFLSKTGYLELGLGVIEKTWQESSISGYGSRAEWEIRARSVALRFAFGNRKILANGFFFGGEWLEIGVPLAFLGNPKAYPRNGEADDAAAARHEVELVKKRLPPYEFSAVRFVVGWLF